MPFVEVPGGRLWFEDSGGGGVAVVFAHPASASGAGWAHQLPAFTAAGLRCVTYDLRGWRRSRPSPGQPGASERGTLGGDLAALVEHLGLERFHLVGAAYGGFAALDYALRWPRRLRSLVLSASQGGVEDAEYVAVRRRVVRPEIRALPVELRELGPSYRAEDPAGVERWLAIEREAGGEAAARQGTSVAITLPMLQTLAVPTLLVAAGADLLAPPALMRLLAARIPDCRLATIAEAGHSAHWERPAEWNRLVLEFLQAH
jgi:pimeloyl-ACP methyl ester carboxylesterase